MASASNVNNTGGDDQDKNMSDRDGEEFEEDQRQYPYTTIARIEVTKNPPVLGKKGELQSANKSPHGAGRSSFSQTRNPFHTLIHSHQFENIPLGKLPSAWDIDHTHAGSGSFEAVNNDGWGGAPDDWNSPMGLLMNRVEGNTEMICNLGYQLEELKETIERLIRIIAPSPPRE